MNRHHPFVLTRLLPYLCALAIALVATLAPARVAWADDVVEVSTWDELKDALEAATNSSNTIQLTGDIQSPSNGGYINITIDVTLDLNGKTLTLYGDTRLVTNTVRNSGGANTLTIQNSGNAGGIVGAGRTQPLFEVNNYGTINLTNVDISGCSVGVVKVEQESTKLVISRCNIHDNTNTNGGAIYASGGTITIREGTRITGNHATDKGGGIFAEGSAAVVIEGGTIGSNRADGADWNYGGGGGICMLGNTKLLLAGGTISNNVSAGGGGGIFFRGAVFTMTGGTVDGNIAKMGEGGGISIMDGSATFKAGAVTNNYTGYDENHQPIAEYGNWGGGGIFISDQGAVAIFPEATLVTKNEAGGFGGGLAACSTGRTYVLDTIGIYGNTAEGKHTSGGESAKHEDHTYAYDSEVFMSNGYQDYFSALYSYITNAMPGGQENWTGSADGEPVSLSGSDTLVASSVCGLTAQPSGSVSNPKLVVQGNVSYTHGGGILNNGIIIYGNQTEIVTAKALSIAGDKSLFDTDANVNLAPLLVNADGSGRCFFEITQEGSDEVLSAGRAVEDIGDDGKLHSYVVFDRRLTFDHEGTYTYLVRESSVSPNWMQLDTTHYKIAVTVAKSENTIHVDSLEPLEKHTITQTVYTISAVSVTKITDANPGGAEFAANLIDLGPEDRGAVVELRNSDNPYAFNNTASSTRSISITKVWDDEGDADGIRATAEEFAGMLTLTADGEVVSGVKPTVTLADANTYTVTYADLPLYTVSVDADGNKVGTEIVYAITETAPEGYTAAYTNDDMTVTDRALDGGTITNSHTPVDRPVPGALPPTGDAGVPLGAVGGLASLGSALICAVALRILREQA